MPSLKAFSQQTPTEIEQKEEEKKPEQVIEVVENTSTLSFDEAWQQYVDTVKNSSKKILISLFEKTSPNYDGTENFKLTVPNKVVEDRLEEEKQDMLIFLRKKTGNAALNLVIDVQVEEVEVAPYTNREKFDSLAKKNPKLLDLKNELDLEIE